MIAPDRRTRADRHTGHCSRGPADRQHDAGRIHSSLHGRATRRLAGAVRRAGTLWGRAARRIKRTLVWNNFYRATSYLRSALWIIPFLSILLVLVVAPVLRVLDGWLGWRLSGLSVSGAQALYQTTITLTLSFVVFTFGSLLVAIQVAGVQLTPRIIATTLLRDNVVRYSVGLFVFTLVFAVMALNRLDRTVSRSSPSSRPCWPSPAWRRSSSSSTTRRACSGRSASSPASATKAPSAIKAVYPEPASAAPDVETAVVAPDGRRRVVLHSGAIRHRSGGRSRHAGGRRAARRRDRRVRAAGGGLRRDRGAVVRALWRRRVDRRIIACSRESRSARSGRWSRIRSLPSASSPTSRSRRCRRRSTTPRPACWHSTSCIACCASSADAGCAATRSPTGRARRASSSGRRTGRISSTSSCTEIRAYGAGNVQIARRLRAMLDNLVATLPAHRHAALDAERRRLDLAIASRYTITGGSGAGGGSGRCKGWEDRRRRACAVGVSRRLELTASSRRRGGRRVPRARHGGDRRRVVT